MDRIVMNLTENSQKQPKIGRLRGYEPLGISTNQSEGFQCVENSTKTEMWNLRFAVRNAVRFALMFALRIKKNEMIGNPPFPLPPCNCLPLLKNTL